MRWIGYILVGLLIWIVVAVVIATSMDLSAAAPGSLEQSVMTRIKRWRIPGKNTSSNVAASPNIATQGAEHFQHHCQICHGLDGQNTGVPLANRMSPPVADLSSPRVQKYTDGQLKWIINHGLRFTGMPGWNGILSDDEVSAIVQYIRHLPPKGSLGAPKIFEEEKEEHEATPGEHKPTSQEEHHH